MALHPVAIAAMVAMAVLIVASNILVEIPINDWLTWGALTYPVCFLVTDVTNRRLGASSARQIVYAGFAVGALMSLVFADMRIAVASGSAFLIAQLLDVAIFDRLRRQTWWQAPLASSLVGSAVDTALFFSLAFAFTGLPWMTWAVGDFGVKVAVALVMLVPFRILMPSVRAA